MDAMNKKTLKNDTSSTETSQACEAANEFLAESRKLVGEIYEESLNKLNNVEHHFKDYSDTLSAKIKEQPIASILIAGGIGFLLSKLLKKQ